MTARCVDTVTCINPTGGVTTTLRALPPRQIQKEVENRQQRKAADRQMLDRDDYVFFWKTNEK